MHKSKTITRIKYENYLNDRSPQHGDQKWIIGGRFRMNLMIKKKYGTALRTYDPIAFEVGFNEWIRNQQNHG